jgi:hypothetical protein
MRRLAIAPIFVVALFSPAFAETTPPTPPPSASTPSGQADATSESIRQHPGWYTEERVPYRPCPCSVVFPGGRHACIGFP